MVKVLIERRFRKDEAAKAEEFLIELRTKALRMRGYVGGETLSSVEEPFFLVTVSTWADEASWKAWESSRERKEIMKRMEPLLASPEKISVFRVLSASGT